MMPVVAAAGAVSRADAIVVVWMASSAVPVRAGAGAMSDVMATAGIRVRGVVTATSASAALRSVAVAEARVVGSARTWRTVAAVAVTVAVVIGSNIAAVMTAVVVMVIGRRSCCAHMTATLLVHSSADVLAPASLVSLRDSATVASVSMTVTRVVGSNIAAVVTAVVVMVVGRRSCGAHMTATLFVHSSSDVLAPASLVSLRGSATTRAELVLPMAVTPVRRNALVV